MQNLLTILQDTLAADPRFVVDGRLLKNKIIECAFNLDADLLRLLVSNDQTCQHFFQKVGDMMVFDKIKFQKFVSNKQFLPESYTTYKNKIGLTVDDNYLADNKSVVLSWPYKDCILEGGQTRDEQKREEVFFNEILDPKSITTLLEPKVFTNFHRYSQNGEQPLSDLRPDDNLIIKGNNLLVLSSLTKIRNIKGKVKMVYIDPPYNTGSDSFGYNDSFNHSTWLVFMKNRLDIAKKLMAHNGIICVQCSFHEYAYLKVLMDEIFPKFLCTFNIQVRHPDRILTGDKEFNDVIEYILIYSNTKECKMPKRSEEKTDDDYIYRVKELSEPERTTFGDKQVEIFTPDKYTLEVCEPAPDNAKKISVRGSLREKNSSGRLYVKYIEPIMSDYPPETLFKVDGMGDDAFGHRYFYTAPQGKKNGGYLQGKPTSSNVTEKPYSNFYNFEKDYNMVSNEGNVSFRNGKKPESLISFLLNIFTSEGDLVLDYHLGSGTTVAVAHKMNRRYIGIEQMDYIQTLVVERLNSVINGDQSGISQEVEWNGGHDFVYCELMADSQKVVDSVADADSDKLCSIFSTLEKSCRLKYNLHDIDSDGFKELSDSDKRKVIVDSLNMNRLYVSYSDIQNKDFSISDEDKALNHKLYGLQ